MDKPLADYLVEAQATARDQLAAAWELEMERLEEQLRSAWREKIAFVVEERFRELAERTQRAVEDRVEALVAGTRESDRRQLCESLTHAVRRIRQAASVEQWRRAWLEEAAAFASQSALLAVNGPWLKCEEARGVELAGQAVLKNSAPALGAALESGEKVVAASLPEEISDTLAAAFGQSAERTLCIFPVTEGESEVAVLCAVAVADAAAAGALDLLAAVAASVHEARFAARQRQPAAAVAGEQAALDWPALSPDERELHLKAQRFTRVRVAELRLYKAAEVKRGRAATNLYAELKEEIDSARDEFRRQFVDACPSMVDYLHRELVRTLANDDPALLGPDYPGALA